MLELHKMYNMTFAANPPDDMLFKLQRKVPQGNSSDWVIVYLHYPFPNAIQAQVKGKVIRPISLIDNNGEDPLDPTVCGSNKYFFYN